MNFADFLILAVVAVCVVVAWRVWRRGGSCSCSGGSCCGNCSACKAGEKCKKKHKSTDNNKKITQSAKKTLE